MRSGALAAWFERQWYARRPTAAARVLSPLAALYGALQARDRAQRLTQAGRRPQPRSPVVVVGNLVAGGAGKTPTTIAIVEALAAAGWRPGVVSRGYGRSGRGVQFAVPTGSAADVGDEPLVIARRTRVPVAVGADRVAAACALEAQAPDIDVIVADDGLQHRQLRRDVALVVFDRRGIGNGLLLPAGPLREPFTAAPPPDALVLYTDGTRSTAWPGAIATRQIAGAARWADWARSDATPRAPPAIRPLSELRDLRGVRWCALAGIATPERFFDPLRAAGLDIDPCPQPDHADHARGTQPPWPAGCTHVITTEKDAVKLGRWASAPGAPHIEVVRLDLALPADFTATLLARLARVRPR